MKTKETVITRKNFLMKGAALAAVAMLPALPGCSSIGKKYAKRKLKTNNPKKALIAWYSNTGHTKRYADLIEALWIKEGISVDNLEYRQVDKSKLKDYDIIIVGTPIFYYDTPKNVRDWLKTLPSINGIAVASFVSFGGPEGNQHNGATNILEPLAEKGGVPVGIDYFMNMSTFPPPKWDSKGTWGHRHLPNEETYNRVRNYSKLIITNIKSDKKIIIDGEFNYRSIFTFLPLGLVRIYYKDHKIDKAKCINCGLCERTCPVGAISPKFKEVKSDKCLLCFGCFHKCPVQAVKMKGGSNQLYSFKEFMKRKKIKIKEPKELS